MEEKKPIILSIIIAIALELVKPFCPMLDIYYLNFYKKHYIMIDFLAAFSVLIGLIISKIKKIKCIKKIKKEKDFIKKYGNFIDKNDIAWTCTFPPLPHCKKCFLPLYFFKKKELHIAICSKCLHKYQHSNDLLSEIEFALIKNN